MIATQRISDAQKEKLLDTIHKGEKAEDLSKKFNVPVQVINYWIDQKRSDEIIFNLLNKRKSQKTAKNTKVKIKQNSLTKELYIAVTILTLIYLVFIVLSIISSSHIISSLSGKGNNIEPEVVDNLPAKGKGMLKSQVTQHGGHAIHAIKHSQDNNKHNKKM